jgi:chemotaxis response regulator CheB
MTRLEHDKSSGTTRGRGMHTKGLTATGLVRPRRIVVLACSAGGLDALVRVLAPLHSDLRAAVVVVQHQRPERHSLLPVILARRSRMPVHEARNGEVLREGCVYVVPAGMHALATTAGTLALIASDGPPPFRPSADLLLTSLAVTAGDRPSRPSFPEAATTGRRARWRSISSGARCWRRIRCRRRISPCLPPP